MKKTIKRVSSNICKGLCDIIVGFIYSLFKKNLVQFSIMDMDAHSYIELTNKTVSNASVDEFLKFIEATEDFAIFNYICGKCFEEYCKIPESILDRKNLISYFRNNYCAQAFLVFFGKWSLILCYRYYQILNYWNSDIGNKKCIMVLYKWTRIIQSLYVVIFDFFFSCIYGFYFFS